MAKPDFSKDYYADLELPATADINEVKKQFKKLALKYHPDRNLGAGNEITVKFQTISAAHEILANPDTKSRYDAQRSRTTSRYPTASGVRGNPWSGVASQFPTPPRRGENPKPPKPPPRPTPSASSRYRDFVPPTAKNTQGDKQSRYQAFESMKGRAQARASKTGQAGPPPAPTARTESQQKKAEASFGNRKSGFVPHSPMGDEPSASGSNYSSYTRHTNVFPETPVKPRRSSHMDPGSAYRDSFADERQSTPYQAHGGEKLNPFDGITNLNRAKSTRESARSSEQTTETPPRRYKSSEDMSPSQNGDPFGNGADRTFAARMSERSNGVDGQQRPANPANQSGQNEFSWNTATNNGQAPIPEKSVPSSANPEPSTYGPNPFFDPSFASFTSQGYRSPEGLGQAGAGVASASHNMSPQFHNLYSRPDPSGSSHSSPSNMTPYEQIQLKVLEELLERQPELVAAVDKAAQSLYDQQSKRADTNFATSFSFPRDNVPYDSAAGKPSMNNSTEKINTSFVGEDHAGTDYQFNAGGPSTLDGTGSMPTPRRTTSGTRLRRKPTAQESRQARPAQSAETLSPDSGDTKASGFNNDDWQEKFSSLNFAPPVPGVQNSSSPTKGPRQARKNSRPVQRTMGSAGLVDEDDLTTSGEDRARPPASGPMPAHVESPNAMDIDPPLPSNGARNINVEPSNPDWRAGNVTSSMPEPPARPPKHPIPSFSTNNAAGSEDTDDFRANLGDLRNVAPLAPSGSGFESLNDLKSHLPFESKASSRIHLDESPTEKKKPTMRINFPRTPIAPRPPPTLVVPNITPTTRAWEDYVNAFSNYLHDWHLYNARFIDHFQARRAQIEGQRRSGGFTWLSARGEAGMDEYMDWIEQDTEVRARWADACNEHAKRTAEFKAYRKAYLDKLN